MDSIDEILNERYSDQRKEMKENYGFDLENDEEIESSGSNDSIDKSLTPEKSLKVLRPIHNHQQKPLIELKEVSNWSPFRPSNDKQIEEEPVKG